jgi:hypothetical protein
VGCTPPANCDDDDDDARVVVAGGWSPSGSGAARPDDTVGASDTAGGWPTLREGGASDDAPDAPK